MWPLDSRNGSEISVQHAAYWSKQHCKVCDDNNSNISLTCQGIVYRKSLTIFQGHFLNEQSTILCLMKRPTGLSSSIIWKQWMA